jgi:pteridine reductase
MHEVEKNAEQPVVWITGSGALRVGRSIVQHFAARGYRIVLHANRSIEQAHAFAAELEATGTSTMVVQGAVERDDFGKRTVEEIVSRFGRIDVLVHSAAVWDWRSLEETSAKDVRRQFEINTLGSFLCSQAAGLQMVQQTHGGSIVLVGDWAVHRPYPDFAAYFVSKGSIETMTRSLAVELATRNPRVRVNAILPGPVLLDTSISSAKADLIKQESLLKMHGTPQHVAEAAYFLATHEFITGVCLPVDGGRSIYAGHSMDAIAHPTK